MPSSLIFAALAAAWIIVLAPMFARSRREVIQTADSALAARVIHRGSVAHSEFHTGAKRVRAQEVFAVHARQRGEFDDRDEPGWDEPVWDDRDMQYGDVDYEDMDDDDPVRRYRPGRGGFNPEAAAQAARAKYAFRQRVVLGMLAAAVITGVVAGFFVPVVWWLHAAIDLGLVGYLVYLRRQVRIEEDIRRRRFARFSGAPLDDHDDVEPDWDDYPDEHDELDEQYVEDESDSEDPREELDEPADEQREMPRREPINARSRPDAHVVELDDEDPVFDELNSRFPEHYRKASGE